MPDREIVQKEVRHGNAQARKVAIDAKFSNITASFFGDKFLRERSYF